ncbi:zinc finger and BTB domain-containing protein 1 [Platysternon megacephalum]|uniref:Zinc finger and BTB domain-containing protein 1 n=1 Tax=Platysternon megacephalum TaxID=55544 RepID=A0A4D9EZ28_9SAUR|nr:zinc finger and BTB domain-containing protein 1 [Platysternon megacephalum]
MIPLLYAVHARQQPPDIIVVHFGENDVGMCKGVKLMLRARRDLRLILALFPGVKIVWSDMLQHRVCQGTMRPPPQGEQSKEVCEHRGGQIPWDHRRGSNFTS